MRGVTLATGLAMLPPLSGLEHLGVDIGGYARAVSGEPPAWFKPSFLDLRRDLEEARASGKRGVMLLFGLRSCPHCRMLMNRTLAEPDLNTTLRRHFDVIYLEIRSEFELRDPQGRSMTVRAFAAREGASFSPTVAFYGLDGQALLRVTGYQTPERFRVTLEQALARSSPPQAQPRSDSGQPGRRGE